MRLAGKCLLKLSRLTPIAIAGTLLSAAPALAIPGQVWDFVDDFDETYVNAAPNGAWTYGYSSTLGGPLIGHGISTPSGFGVPGYQAAGSAPLNSIFTGVNRTGATVSWAPPNYFLLDNEGFSQAPWPGPAAEKAIVRWTAPESGKFQVDAWFGGGWTGGATMDVYMHVNGVSVLTDTLLGYAGDDQGHPVSGSNPVVTYNSVLMLNAGDTVDMIVGDGGSAGGDIARQTLTITQVPEPSSAAMSVLCVLGLGAIGTRRKRNV